MKLQRASSLTFELESGMEITVPPVTRGQMRRVLQLDSAEMETPLERAERIARQMDILLERAEFRSCGEGLLDWLPAREQLDATEEVQIYSAICAAQHGYDPQSVVELQQAMAAIVKKNVRKGGDAAGAETPLP